MKRLCITHVGLSLYILHVWLWHNIILLQKLHTMPSYSTPLGTELPSRFSLQGLNHWNQFDKSYLSYALNSTGYMLVISYIRVVHVLQMISAVSDTHNILRDVIIIYYIYITLLYYSFDFHIWGILFKINSKYKSSIQFYEKQF